MFLYLDCRQPIWDVVKLSVGRRLECHIHEIYALLRGQHPIYQSCQDGGVQSPGKEEADAGVAVVAFNVVNFIP